MTEARADLIAALREVADWLEAHPEIEPAAGLISVYAWGSESREILTRLATALGHKANERTEGGRVYIEGHFGDHFRILGSAPVDALGGEAPPTPSYEPIIPAAKVA